MKKCVVLLCIILVLFAACDTPLPFPPGGHNVSEEEYNIISETNRVRTRPGDYAAMLEAELLTITNQPTRDVYQAAIDTLRAASPRNPVVFEGTLYLAACAHAEDLIATNTFSHNSSNGNSFSQRLQLFGTAGYAGENLAAGTVQNTGAKVVKQWVLSPGHLGNILNVNYNQLGACLKSGHPTYNWISVQDFARDFKAK